jgi:hypothetical protein
LEITSLRESLMMSGSFLYSLISFPVKPYYS